MAKIAEAQNRLFKNIFVDRRTGRKIRADPTKVVAGKVRGRGKRGSRALRPLKKK
jgi:hypothetical protein